MEGIAVGAANDGGVSRGYFWGENLRGALQHPVVLRDESKLVYSPHTYGPSVRQQHYFNRAEGFPTNMPDIWNQHFLNVRRARGESVVVGGFGGRFQSEEDQNWHIKAVSYFVNNRVSSFY